MLLTTQFPANFCYVHSLQSDLSIPANNNDKFPISIYVTKSERHFHTHKRREIAPD